MSLFWEKLSRGLRKKSVKGDGECILWTGSRDRDGYGRKMVKWSFRLQKVERVHRVAYMVTRRLTKLPRTDNSGELLDVSHLCRSKLCINPEHLVLESHLSNMSRIHCGRAGVCSLEHSPPCVF